jgi:class 3 adenylate cyclase
MARIDLDKLRALLPPELKSFLGNDLSQWGPRERGTVLEHLKSIAEAVASFLPRIVAEEKLSRRPSGQAARFLDAAILVADIAGFTALSESLSRPGRKGAEELTAIINRYFSSLLGTLFKYGGDLYRFSGDALLAVFRDEPQAKTIYEMRALQAALEVQSFMRDFAVLRTSVGDQQVGMHVAVHSGKVLMMELGEPNLGLEHYLGGRTMHEIALLEDRSEAGDILVSKTMIKKLGKSLVTEAKPSGEQALTGLAIPVAPLDEARKPPGTMGFEEEAASLTERIYALAPFLHLDLFQRIVTESQRRIGEGEHRRVSVLFLVAGGLDLERDSGAADKLAERYKAVQRTVKSFGGIINKVDVTPDGDRVMILFGVPQAYEDHETRALICARELLADRGAAALGLWQKAGCNAGHVFAGSVGSRIRREFTVMGDEVNVAARLASLAQRGEILTSEKIKRRAKGSFAFTPRGEVQVKGKTAPVEVFKVEGREEKPSLEGWVSESLALVGRTPELALLDEAIASALEGKGQIVSLVGEAGIGKSRLLKELLARWQGKGGRVFSGNCQSFGNVLAYLPWISVLESCFGMNPQDPAARKAAKIEEGLKSVDPALGDWASLVGEALGVPLGPGGMEEKPMVKFLDAKLRRERLLDIVFQVLAARSEKEPLGLAIEDLHWMDAASLDLLNYVARNLEGKKILLALAYRPVEKKWEFMEKPFHRELRLRELVPSETSQLVANLLQAPSLPAELKDLVLSKTQGNPFFVEEVIKTLRERGAVSQEGGAWKISAALSAVEVPDTVQGVLMSRIDRLSPAEKNILQVAAVIGREFDFDILSGIAPQKERLSQALSELTRLDLILQGESGKMTYLFKHVLTQEVAYESLAFSRRHELHRSIGDFIERAHEKALDERLGLLALHYSRGEAWDKALDYSVRAGDRAKKVYANEEALRFYDLALEVFDHMEKEGYRMAVDDI